MTDVEYVMGKEMLRQSVDNLLNALLRKTVNTSTVRFDGTPVQSDAQNPLIVDPERKLLVKAAAEIDDWDDDEDVLEVRAPCDSNARGLLSPPAAAPAAAAAAP
eukprot:3536633-Prymnesium_polylepis.1